MGIVPGESLVLGLSVIPATPRNRVRRSAYIQRGCFRKTSLTRLVEWGANGAPKASKGNASSHPHDLIHRSFPIVAGRVWNDFQGNVNEPLVQLAKLAIVHR